MNILKILIGPPKSFNLRNLIWHGFVSDIQAEFPSLLFLVIATLGKTYAARVTPYGSQFAPLNTFAKLQGTTVESERLDGIVWDREDFSNALEAADRTGSLIVRQRKALWLEALDLFHTGKYGASSIS